MSPCGVHSSSTVPIALLRSEATATARTFIGARMLARGGRASVLAAGAGRSVVSRERLARGVHSVYRGRTHARRACGRWVAKCVLYLCMHRYKGATEGAP